ncbi:MAG: hypothetical protein HC819_02140 [Cyclobacteriaceae bacterium]|nr:hypothetical protein [Cyclobacteriaceae bacterium]
MKALALIFLFLSLQMSSKEKTRQLQYNGATVMTTFGIDSRFLGKYTGSKKGYLQLNENGEGTYRYDYPGISPECKGENIDFKWGFILDDNGEIVRFKRDYGYSYPVIYNCTSENTFQGCTKNTMVDYVLEYDNGTITISSSDDWVKHQQ